MSRVRVALVTPGFSADDTDWCIPALLELAAALATRVDLTVFALRYPHRQGEWLVRGVRVVGLGGATSRGFAKARLMARAARTIVARGPFDVVHAVWADEPGVVGLLAARWMRSRLVVSLFGGELAHIPAIAYGGRLHWSQRLQTSASLAAASVITAGSRWLLEHVPAGLRQKARLLPLGVDLERFSPGDVTVEGAPRIVSVGSLVPVKGHDRLLRAFAAVHRAEPRATLDLIGEGPLLEPLRAQAEGLPVRFLGSVRHEMLPALLRGATCHVVSSHWEAQHMGAIEAAACGVPSVGFPVGVVPELDSALATTEEELASAILRTLSATGARVAARQAGSRFSIEAAAGAALAAYRGDEAATG